MPKKEKDKKAAPATALPPGAAEEARQLEVHLCWNVKEQAAPDVLMVVRLNGHDHFVQPRQLPTDAQPDAGTAAPPGPSPTGPAPPTLVLATETLYVGEAAGRHTALNDRSAHRVDVYMLPSPGDLEDSGIGGGGGKAGAGAGGKRRKSGAGAAAKGKGKAPAGLTTVPEGARRIGGATLTLIPLLSGPSVEVALPLAPGSLSDAGDCLHLRVQCREPSLLSPKLMTQCRPVLVRVLGVEGLPATTHRASSPVSRGEAPGTATAAAAVAAVSRRRLRACVTLAGGKVSSSVSALRPPAPASAAKRFASSAVATVLQPDEPAASGSSPDDDATSAAPGHVLFLDELGSPLDVYRLLHSTPCEVSLWQSFEMDASGPSAAAADKAGTEGKSSEALLGAGRFSVRDFLTDNQTRFSEVVQLLPSRLTIDVAQGRTGCTIAVRLDFFQPFTAVQHVDKEGQPLPRRAFLTRALVRLPYAVPWTADCLALILREVTAAPRATQDVQLYLPPPPPPPAVELPEKERPGGGRGATAHNRSPVSTPATASTATARTPGGGAQRPGKGSLHGLTPEPPAAAPAASFAEPLKLYTPPGLSGFEVADGEERFWCFEGTVPEVQRVLNQLSGFVESRSGATAQVQLLFNAELFVPKRAYIKFPPLVIPPAGMAAAASPASAEGDGAVAALEVEPSGTGGRLHRIRLRSAVGKLCQTQSHYVRHTLSDDCLHCLQSLAALRGATSMREAEGRGWMPSATLLIAVERSFGQTLEKEDLFGATPTAVSGLEPTAAHDTPTASHRPTVVTGSDQAESATAEKSLLADTRPGALVFFDGMLKAGTRRSVPAVVRLRFPVSAWMVVTATKEEVLCAFPHNTPTGLVQYHIEGQVVHCATVTVLYVLKCACLARSVTHSHNAAFEHLLRERQREQLAILKEKTAPSASTKSATSPSPVEEGAGGGGGMGSRSCPAPTRTAAGARGGEDSSDEEDGAAQDWLDPEMDHHLYSAVKHTSRSAAVAERVRGGGARAAALLASRRRAAETARQAAGLAGSAKPELTSEDLWRLYERRAPASDAVATAAEREKLPPIRL